MTKGKKQDDERELCLGVRFRDQLGLTMHVPSIKHDEMFINKRESSALSITHMAMVTTWYYDCINHRSVLLNMAIYNYKPYTNDNRKHTKIHDDG